MLLIVIVFTNKICTANWVDIINVYVKTMLKQENSPCHETIFTSVVEN